MKFQLHEFDPNLMQCGQSAFPFSITLPEWLPESVMLIDNTTKLMVTYTLTAFLTPRSGPIGGLSAKDERQIFVYKEQDDFSDQFGGDNDDSRLAKKLVCKVGGVFGLASDDMEAIVQLVKDQFVVGEAVPITFSIDNSRCGRDIKSLKVKFHREIVVFKEKGKKNPAFTQSEFIEEIKLPCDVKGKTKADKKITYNIPTLEKPEKVGRTD